jgi:hypothetical protein
VDGLYDKECGISFSWATSPVWVHICALNRIVYSKLARLVSAALYTVCDEPVRSRAASDTLLVQDICWAALQSDTTQMQRLDLTLTEPACDQPIPWLPINHANKVSYKSPCQVHGLKRFEPMTKHVVLHTVWQDMDSFVAMSGWEYVGSYESDQVLNMARWHTKPRSDWI